jgi:myo-inositol-1(or 4)-monophosphatase
VSALDVAVAAARAGADELRRAAGGDLEIAYKDARANLVTIADRRSQDAITQVLLEEFPGDAVDGEEGRAGPPDAERVWYVDPLDGTTNYSRGMPFYCVSIALRVAGETTAGVVYDPVRDEMFAASKGAAATVNGQPLRVSGVSRLDRALVVAQAQSSVPAEIRAYAELVEALMLACGGVRAFGSPALTLCAIACGRLDAYCEHAMAAWDIAAGQLILEQAGGTLTTFTGAPHRSAGSADVVASNGLIQAELVSVLKGLLWLTRIRPRCPSRRPAGGRGPDGGTWSRTRRTGSARRTGTSCSTTTASWRSTTRRPPGWTS